MIISIEIGKVLDKSHHTLYKKINKVGFGGDFLNLIKYT